MTDHRPGQHNSVKKQARAYQRQHPGTAYAAALAVVTSAGPALPSTGWEPLVVSRTIRQLDALVARHEADVQAGSVRPLRIMFTGPAGTGKDLALTLLARKLGLAGPTVWAELFRSNETVAGPKQWLRMKMDAAEGGILVMDPSDLQFTWSNASNAATDALTEMADRGRRLAVILMQYTDHDWEGGPAATDYETAARQSWVQSYLDTNFSEHVIFASLSVQEIVAVAAAFAEEHRHVLTQDAVDTLSDRVSALSSETTPLGTPVLDLLGNARFARSVVETAATFRDARNAERNKAGAVSLVDLTEITRSDIIASVDQKLGWARSRY